MGVALRPAPARTLSANSIVFGWRRRRDCANVRLDLADSHEDRPHGTPHREQSPCSICPPPRPAADYAIVKRAIEFISTRWRDQPSVEEIAGARRALAVALPARVQALGRADAQGLPPGDHHRARARTAAQFRERARRGLRRRALGPEPPARSLRHPRGADAGRLSARRPRAALRLPPFAVRRGDRRRRAARHGGARLRRRRRPRGGARRHAPALAARAVRADDDGRPRPRRGAPSIPRNGGPTRRCAW